jgi:hypothetical protein
MAFAFTESLAASAASSFCSSHDKFYSGLSVPTVESNDILLVPDGFQYIVGGELLDEGDTELGVDAEIVAV